MKKRLRNCLYNIACTLKQELCFHRLTYTYIKVMYCKESAQKFTQVLLYNNNDFFNFSYLFVKKVSFR